jgi:hypothetical protein
MGLTTCGRFVDLDENAHFDLENGIFVKINLGRTAYSR